MSNQQKKPDIWRQIRDRTTKKQRQQLGLNYNKSTKIQLQNFLNNIPNLQAPPPKKGGISQYNELRKQAQNLGVYDHKNKSKAALLEAIFNALNKVPFIEEKKERESKEKDRRLYIINELYKEAEKLGIPNYKNLSPTQLNKAIQQKYKEINLKFRILKIIKEAGIIIPKKLPEKDRIDFIIYELENRAKEKRIYESIAPNYPKNPIDKMEYILKKLNEVKEYFPFIQLLDKLFNLTPIPPTRYFNPKIAKLREENEKRKMEIINNVFGIRAFTLLIYSSKIDGVIINKHFQHIQHLINWFLKFTRENKNSGTDEFQLYQGNDVYEYIDYEIYFSRGGCSRLVGCHKQIKDDDDDENYEGEDSYENSRYIFNVYSPKSRHNNCGLECIREILKRQVIELKESNAAIRKKYNIEANTKIDINDMKKIYNGLSLEYGYNRPMAIIDLSYKCDIKNLVTDYSHITRDKNNRDDVKAVNDCFNEQAINYLMLNGGHYTILESIEDKYNAENKKIFRKCRGVLFWDCEARKDLQNPRKVNIGLDENGDIIYRDDHKLIDTITQVYYRPRYKREYRTLLFETDRKMRSVEKFRNWLIYESRRERYYNGYSWNGSRFDNYLFSSCLDYNDTLLTKYNFRGKDMIQIQFYGHAMKDPYNFITSSLETAGKNFKIDSLKQTSFNFRGKTMTNMDLCFYRPELDIYDFMELKHKEPDFWALYCDYCRIDCVAMAEIWEKFGDSVNNIVEKIDPKLMKYCRLDNSMTIGGLSMKIINNLNKGKADYKNYRLFMAKSSGKGVDDEKYKFLVNFIRGGISHTQKAGLHLDGSSGYDVNSEYPDSMANMWIPVGISNFTDEYDPSKYGYYHIKNLMFDKCPYRFKPVSLVGENGILNWDTGDFIPEAYLNGETIEYLRNKFNLVSFEVVRGLVSTKRLKGNKLFGRYIYPMCQTKSEIDKLPAEERNHSLRNAIKLFVNCISGKLVESSHKYENTHYLIKTDEIDTDTRCERTINGVGLKSTPAGKLNKWLNAGLSVYFDSKLTIFKYMECLPEFSNDVIQCETDAIYVPTCVGEYFKKNLEALNCKRMRLGGELGNIVCEKSGVENAYFLGKKFYKMGHNMKCKGVAYYSLKTVKNEAGTMEVIKETIIKPELYEDIFKQGCLCPHNKRLYDCEICEGGGGVKLSFSVLSRELHGETCIISSDITRTIKPPDGVIYKTWRDGKAVN